MKKQILLWLLLAVVLTAGAVPAQRGIWKYIRLADGNRVRVELCGDEHLHFWRAATALVMYRTTVTPFTTQWIIQLWKR